MFDLIKSVLSYPHLLITSKGYSWCIKVSNSQLKEFNLMI